MQWKKLKQVVMPSTPAAPDVISLLEQIDISPGRCHEAIELTNTFLFRLVTKDH
jgi:hypothetical protein